MPFPTQPARIPTSLGRVSYTVTDPTGAPAQRTITAVVEILDQTGAVMGTWSGNAAPHLPAAQINAQQSFATILRDIAADGLLP